MDFTFGQSQISYFPPLTDFMLCYLNYVNSLLSLASYLVYMYEKWYLFIPIVSQ